MPKVHVLQTFGFAHDGSRRELERGLHQIDDDVADSIRNSEPGSSLVTAGLLRFVEEPAAPKPKKRRGRKPAADDAPTPTESE